MAVVVISSRMARHSKSKKVNSINGVIATLYAGTSRLYSTVQSVYRE
jgi:hypothetical protein